MSAPQSTAADRLPTAPDVFASRPHYYQRGDEVVYRKETAWQGTIAAVQGTEVQVVWTQGPAATAPGPTWLAYPDVRLLRNHRKRPGKGY